MKKISQEINVEVIEYGGEELTIDFDKNLVYKRDIENDWVQAGTWDPNTELPILM